MTDNLPPLPSHPEHGWVWTEAEQRAIRGYAEQAVAAERERLRHAVILRSKDTYGVLLQEHAEAAAWIAEA